MTRNEWKALSRRLRTNAGHAVRSELVDHGGTWWNVHFVKSGSDAGLHCTPAIIRDKSTGVRLADSLDWTRAYRRDMVRHKRNGSYFAGHARQAFQAALACLVETRDIRTTQSAFFAMP